jgi:Flp pilus assembly protein TadD
MSIREDLPISDPDCRVEAPPSWMDPREPDWGFDVPAGNPTALLLVDEQHHVPSRTLTNRIVRRLLTPEAVARFREVEFEFDAASRRFCLHDLTVWRREPGGGWESQSLTESIRLQLRPPQDGSGRRTVVAVVDFLEVGDALDLTWSLPPLAAIAKRPFACLHAFFWKVPCGVTHFTIHDDPIAPVRFRMDCPDGIARPDENSVPGLHHWKQERPPITRLEADAPPGVWNFPVLEVSGWRDWKEVAAWTHQIWGPALSAPSLSFGPHGRPLPTSVPELVRLVQDDIGDEEDGPANWLTVAPKDPQSVLRDGQGDAASKAVLLTVLLRQAEVKAWPLLVNLDWRDKLQSLLPTPGAFNHVIVTFQIAGQRHFVDPTERSRPGPLESWTAPAFGCGLEVDPNASGLISLPAPNGSEWILTETFRLAEGVVEQKLRATDEFAEEIRETVHNKGRQAFLTAQIEALQTQFPTLRPTSLVLKEDGTADAVELQGSYDLPEAGPAGEFRHRAYGLIGVVECERTPGPRTVARALRHPMRARHSIVVEHPEIRSARPERRSFDGPAFRYTCELTRDKGRATIDHRWETTADRVEASDWTEYCRKVADIFDRLETVISLRPSPSLSVPVRSIAWVSALVLGVLVGGTIFTKVSGFRTQSAQDPPPAEVQAEVEKALEAATQGDLTSAEPLLEKRQEQFQENPAFQFIRAEVALRMGQFDRAREALARAKALDPANVNNEVLTAALRRAEGDDSSAKEILTETIERNPNDPRPQRELALTLTQKGDVKGAMEAWARVLQLVPGDANALRQYAVLLWQSGEKDRADSIIRQALTSQNTPNAEVEAAAADYYTLTGRRAEALQRLEKAATLDPEDRTRDFALASGHLRMGRAREAADLASQLTRDFPTDVRAWQVLAVAKSILGDGPSAEAAYREWMRLAPQDPKGPANFGYFLHQSGRNEEARDLLAQASTKFPREGMIWLNYASVLEALGDAPGGKNAREQASNLLTAEEKQLLIR